MLEHASTYQARKSLTAGAEILTWLADERVGDVLRIGRELSVSRGRILTTGVGKAGTVARAIAELFAASGTPAHFLHPTEAMHGDLGVVCPGDDVLVISWSGETRELLELVPHLNRRRARVIALTSSMDSQLSREADMVLSADLAIESQVNEPPTTSTLALLAMGQALVLTVLELKTLPGDVVFDLHPATWNRSYEH